MIPNKSENKSNDTDEIQIKEDSKKSKVIQTKITSKIEKISKIYDTSQFKIEDIFIPGMGNELIKQPIEEGKYSSKQKETSKNVSESIYLNIGNNKTEISNQEKKDDEAVNFMPSNVEYIRKEKSEYSNKQPFNQNKEIIDENDDIQEIDL